MASAWDIISAAFFLGIFIAVIYYGSKFASLLEARTTSTTSSLQSRGVSYDPTTSRVSLKTDRAPPSRDEYIQNIQVAFKRGAHGIKAHKDAFGFKKGSSEGAQEANEKRGFTRTKKLD
nr:hypothetical protein L204_04532 [Cryptococcus depauperatus CBS 7855]